MWRNILLLAHLCFSVKSFDSDTFDPTKFEVIHKTLPEVNELEVGENLVFKCEVSHEYEWCGFFHKNCTIQPNENNCTENNGMRANVTEDPDKKFCQLALEDVSIVDEGNWTCKFKRNHSLDTSGIANDFITLHIKINLTSSTSVPTTIFTTDDEATTTITMIHESTQKTALDGNGSADDEAEESSGTICDDEDNEGCENVEPDEGSGSTTTISSNTTTTTTSTTTTTTITISTSTTTNPAPSTLKPTPIKTTSYSSTSTTSTSLMEATSTTTNPAQSTPNPTQVLALFIVIVPASSVFLLLIIIGSIIYCKCKKKCCFGSEESYGLGHDRKYSVRDKFYDDEDLPKRSRMSFKKYTKVNAATEFPLHRQTESIPLSNIDCQMSHISDFPMSRI